MKKKKNNKWSELVHYILNCLCQEATLPTLLLLHSVLSTCYCGMTKTFAVLSVCPLLLERSMFHYSLDNITEFLPLSLWCFIIFIPIFSKWKCWGSAQGMYPGKYIAGTWVATPGVHSTPRKYSIYAPTHFICWKLFFHGIFKTSILFIR